MRMQEDDSVQEQENPNQDKDKPQQKESSKQEAKPTTLENNLEATITEVTKPQEVASVLAQSRMLQHMRWQQTNKGKLLAKIMTHKQFL